MFYVHFSERKQTTTYQNAQEIAEIDMCAYKSAFFIKKYCNLAPHEIIKVKL